MKSAINDHAQKLIALIGSTVGASASEEFPFNIAKLEQQALRYLKLENG